MRKNIDNISEKELLEKKKRHHKKAKSKLLTGEVKDALAKKKFNKRQSY